MKQVLLVEDSSMFGRLIKKKIEIVFDVPVFWTKTLEETIVLLEMAKGDFAMALLDYNLPDAPRGEVIDRVLDYGISSLVITGDMSDEVRRHVWSKKVADYILKEDPNSLDNIIATMRQLAVNEEKLILVVDDSPTFRNMITELLYIRKFRVINAADGAGALRILQQYPEIKIVIIDYNMPGMDGCQLCQKIRENHKPERLAVIGVSSETDLAIGARFIKSGANDFIVKQSFLVEEFYCRVNHCLETLSLIEKIKESAVRDFLTGLYNRRYFFEAGKEIFRCCHAKSSNLACAMIDIDFFKKVNDTYGHDVGDQVIVSVAEIINNSFKKDSIVARFGGEEFCILTPEDSRSNTLEKFERLRQRVENSSVAQFQSDSPVYVTISIGICMVSGVSLEAMINTADEQLYIAKHAGRNRLAF
jgi:diguanylate cyclase (GGDEF)-like protein